MTRRDLLWNAGGGAAGLALAQLLQGKGTHFPAKAKRLIMIFLPGGLSAVDTYDYKPELVKHHGKETQGANTITPFFGKRGTVMQSPWKFARHGQSGKWVSELLPHLATCVDDTTFVHSMVTRSNAHGPALFQMSTGFIFQGFPSIGSWISYGLGSENENLPSFVVLPDRRGLPPCGVANWGNGFLPAVHQGVAFGTQEQPIANLRPPAAVNAKAQAASYDLLSRLNESHAEANPGEDALVSRIRAYELAAKMQLAAPEVTDIRGETEATRKAYGLDDPEMRDYGYNCLLARRLMERGVRVIQMYNGGHFGAPRVNWDAHEDLITNHGKNARILDQPADLGRFGRRRARPQPRRLHVVDGRAGPEKGLQLRVNRRDGLQSGGEPGDAVRFSRDDSPSDGARPHAAELVPQRPAAPVDRRARTRDQAAFRLARNQPAPTTSSAPAI
jgi:hypothetical protein